MSRHMACKNCRDRKVKCDGNQPACEKCSRAGEPCLYVQSSFMPSRGEMLQTIESLQERIAKAEAQLQEQKPEAATRNTILGNSYSPTMSTYNPMPDLQAPFPGTAPRNAMFQSGGDFRNLSQAYNDPDDTNEFLFRSLHTNPHTNLQSIRVHTQPQEEGPPIRPRHDSLPSLNELRAINCQNGSDISSGSDVSRMWENDESKLRTATILEFLSSIFAIQADITGMSSAVAEYLAWIVKSPGRAENSEILGILEARVRELNEIASTRHWAALKLMIASTEKGVLRHIEMDLMGKTIKTMQFFHEGYHIDSALSEQRQD